MALQIVALRLDCRMADRISQQVNFKSESNFRLSDFDRKISERLYLTDIFSLR